jgi:hypothetical protein
MDIPPAPKRATTDATSMLTTTAFEVLTDPDLLGCIDASFSCDHDTAVGRDDELRVGSFHVVLSSLCKDSRTTLLEVQRRRLGCPTTHDAWVLHSVGRRIRWIRHCTTELAKSVNQLFPIAHQVRKKVRRLSSGRNNKPMGRMISELQNLACAAGVTRDKCSTVLPHIDTKDTLVLLGLPVFDLAKLHDGHDPRAASRCGVQAVQAASRLERVIETTMMRGVPSVPYLSCLDTPVGVVSDRRRAHIRQTYIRKATPGMVEAARCIARGVASLHAVLHNALHVDAKILDDWCALTNGDRERTAMYLDKAVRTAYDVYMEAARVEGIMEAARVVEGTHCPTTMEEDIKLFLHSGFNIARTWSWARKFCSMMAGYRA